MHVIRHDSVLVHNCVHFIVIYVSENFCSKCLPTHYPVKGLHLMKVGKMQLLINGQTRKAIEKLYQVASAVVMHASCAISALLLFCCIMYV